MNNLLEYAFNSNPLDSAGGNGQGALPSAGVTNLSGIDYLTISFQRRIVNDGMTYMPESSGDLGDWSGVPVLLGEPIAIGDGVLERVTYRDSVPMSGKRYLRLRFGAP